MYSVMFLNTAGDTIEMRTSQTTDPLTASTDEHTVIFRPLRSYPYCPSRNRPSLISSKYKQKDERRKVLKISLSKLKKIDDPEMSLCRSVLINNTTKRLQQETRNEKMQKQQLMYPRCNNDDGYSNIRTEFLTNDKPLDKIMFLVPENNKIEEIIIDNDFHAKLEEEINHAKVNDNNNNNKSTITCVVQDSDIISPVINHKQDVCPSSRKRVFDEIEERDMHEVFCLPSPPRMLSGIDEEDLDVNIIGDDSLAKRLKNDDQMSANNNENTDLKCHTTYLNSSSGLNSFLINNLTLPRHGNSNSSVVEGDSFSCRHASMLGDLQGNTFYQNLITSLET